MKLPRFSLNVIILMLTIIIYSFENNCFYSWFGGGFTADDLSGKGGGVHWEMALV